MGGCSVKGYYISFRLQHKGAGAAFLAHQSLACANGRDSSMLFLSQWAWLAEQGSSVQLCVKCTAVFDTLWGACQTQPLYFVATRLKFKWIVSPRTICMCPPCMCAPPAAGQAAHGAGKGEDEATRCSPRRLGGRRSRGDRGGKGLRGGGCA